MRETDPAHSHKYRSTLSSSSIRDSNLEQESAPADCLEAGIQVLHSFPEVTTVILYNIYAIYVQYLNLKSKDSMHNSNTDVVTVGES